MAPLERSGFVFGHIRMSLGGAQVEAGLTPETDILSVHAAPFRVEARTDGKLVHDGPVSPGWISIARAGVRTEVSLSGEIDIVQLFMPRERLAMLSAEIHNRPVDLAYQGFRDDPALSALAFRAARAAGSAEPADRLIGDIGALAVAERLLRSHNLDGRRLPDGAYWRGGLSPRVLRLVADFMDEHLESDVPLAALSRLAGLSDFHFIRAFKASTGLTPHVWLLHRRIARIKRLLLTRAPDIAEIARLTGYSSPSAMAAAFRRATGFTPSEWRRSASVFSSA